MSSMSSFTSEVRRNVAYLAILVILFTNCQLSSATSCGEPRLSAEDKCSDWQCTRIIYPNPLKRNNNNINNNPTDQHHHSDLRIDIPDEQQDGTYFGHGICVRGLGEGAKCQVDDDCFVKKYVCRNTSIHVDENTTVWDKRCVEGEDIQTAWQGYVGVAVAVVGFGTNFVPAKQVRSGNGMLFQLAQCLGVIIAGICTALITKSYTLYPMSLIGGMLWCLGNCLCVPVIQLVGLGIGLSVWGTMNMLVGWASGRFGLMGVASETAPTPWRSYCGVGVAIIAICAFAAVKPSATKKTTKASSNKTNDEAADERDGLLTYSAVSLDTVNAQQHPHIYAADEEVRRNMEVAEKQQSGAQRRVLGLVLAVIAGVFFGLNFNPSQAMMGHYVERTLEDPKETPSLHFSPIGVDYFFSFSVGVIMTSILVAVFFYGLHTIPPRQFVKKFVPSLLSDMHLLDFGTMLVPGFVSGLIWSAAQIGWFVANTNLGLTVSFPMVAVGPAVVANAWGIVLFKEVEGRRNFILLGTAFALVGVSCGFTVWAQY